MAAYHIEVVSRFVRVDVQPAIYGVLAFLVVVDGGLQQRRRAVVRLACNDDVREFRLVRCDIALLVQHVIIVIFLGQCVYVAKV